VRAVHVGIGHDDDFVVAQVVDVELVANAGADGLHKGLDLVALQGVVHARLFDVEDLAAQGEDCLEAAIAPLLGRAAGRVPLDDVQLGALGIAL